ncbi:PAS domain S-box protein [bacterium]|nr:PAS domain S-box protein [bacterium]
MSAKSKSVQNAGVFTDPAPPDGHDQLKAIAQSYRYILDNCPDYIVILDKSGSIIDFSSNVPLLLKKTAKELIGRKVPSLLTSASAREYKKEFPRRLARETVEGEFQLSQTGNSDVWIWRRSIPLQNKMGELVGFLVFGRDISQQKNAEQEIKNKILFQEQVLKTTRDLNSSLELKKVLTTIGKSAMDLIESYSCVIYMLDKEGKKLLPVVAIDPLHEEEVMATPLDLEGSFTGQSLKLKRPMVFNDAFNSKLGQPIPGTPENKDERVIVAPFISGKQLLGAMCLNRIGECFTEEDLKLAETFASYAEVALKNAYTHQELQMEMEKRVKVQEKLRFSYERWRSLIMNLPDVIASIDKKGDILAINRPILGDPPEKIVGRNVYQVYLPQIKLEDVKGVVKRVFQTGKPSSFEICTEDIPDIGDFCYDIRVFPAQFKRDQVTEVILCGTDITDRKKIFKELMASREKWRNLVMNLPDIIITVDKHGKILDMNRQVTKKPLEQILGTSIYDYLRTQNREFVENALETALITGEQSSYQVQAYGPEGPDTAWYETRIIPSRETHDTTQATLIITDITKRKRALDALKESEEKFRTLAENIPGVIYLCKNDDRYTMIYLNDAVEKLTGYPPKEFLSDKISFVDMYHPDEREKIFEEVNKAIGLRLPFHLTYRIKNASGEWIWVEEIGVGIYRDSELTHLEGFLWNIDEKKRFEEELLKTQKFESIALLAGGIAHDFNNILVAILGNISLALKYAEKETPLADILSKSEKAALRAKSLTQQLLTFSRGDAPSIRTIAIGETLREACLFATQGSTCQCKFAIPDDLWSVQADRTQILQVIDNLVINAVQAMPKGGYIEIRAENAVLKPRQIIGLEPGEYVMLIIKDYGKGINEDDLSKVFDPYYTTKPEGSGLGLATVYSIIKRHQGHISLESSLEIGTTFTIYLPAVHQEHKAKEPEEARIKMGKGRVLVMDDRKIVRKVAGMMIEKLGYEVEFAGDGEKALKIYGDFLVNKKPFDLVIMDLTIPGGMGAVDTLKAIKKIHPEAKAVISSGYTNDPAMINYQEYGFVGFLPKPYRISELSELLSVTIISGRKNNVEKNDT